MRPLPHQILKIPPDASEAEAKAAYRKLAQVHHPDKGGDPEKFQALGAALKHFRRTLPCPVCTGKGFVETKSGLAIKRDRCPKCWSTEKP